MSRNEKQLLSFSDYDEAIRAVRAKTDALALTLGHRPGYYIQTFGCQQNEADSEHYAGMAEEMGYTKAESEDAAELILFNTCAVREHAELKALSLTGQLKKLKETNPNLVICICGCMVAQEHRLNKIRQSYPYVDFLFGTSQPERFPEFLAKELYGGKRGFYPDPEEVKIAEGLPVKRESGFKAWVSIMYGCNNFCTYCVVPHVRGRERSRKKEDILREIKGLVAEGFKEITLLGQNVNSYGHGLYEDYSFADLLEDICKIEGEYWIRFMTSHPKDASKKLIDVMAEHSKPDSRPRIARAFHLPVQSGSDTVLRAMNRRYTSAQYRELLTYMREKMPDIAVSTDVIVGFPGETEEDFEHTLEMLRFARYDAFFSFLYSPRPGTPAAEMEQIPEEIKAARFARLLETQNEISLEKNRAQIGQTVTALVEGRSKNDETKLTARNEQGRLIHFEGDDSLTGTFVRLKITDADTYVLWGKTENNG